LSQLFKVAGTPLEQFSPVHQYFKRYESLIGFSQFDEQLGQLFDTEWQLDLALAKTLMF